MFDPWTCLYIDRLLLENAFRTIQRIPSSIVEDRLSNPYLERTYPDLRQRWDTRGAARLRRQIFPALQIVDIIPVLREALGVSESYLAHTPTANLPEHGRNYTRGVTEFFEAFISANSKHALPSDSGPKRDGRFGLSSNDTPSFIVFRFPREDFDWVQSVYFDLLFAGTSRDGRIIDQEKTLGPKPLAWEWSFNSEGKDFIAITQSDPDTVPKYRATVMGRACVYLRTPILEILRRLHDRWWEVEVLKWQACAGRVERVRRYEEDEARGRLQDKSLEFPRVPDELDDKQLHTEVLSWVRSNQGFMRPRMAEGVITEEEIAGNRRCERQARYLYWPLIRRVGKPPFNWEPRKVRIV